MSSPATAAGTSFGRTLRAEWIKFRSLRSMRYTLAGLFAAGFGLTMLLMGSAGQKYQEVMVEGDVWDPTSFTLQSYILAQLIIGVLGSLVVTSEYATGMMSTSLTATPRRNQLLSAKVMVVAAVAVTAGTALMFAAFFFGQAVLIAQDVPHAALGDPGVLAAVAGGGLYLAVIAVLAVGLGAIMRATAGALVALVGIVYLVPGFAGAFPPWVQPLFDFWPTLGAAAILETVPNPDFPNPWLGFGGMCLGVAAVLAAAFVVFRRRDV
ncbi:ABC transporter permease [Streptomonospora arabica]|uniref:ABC transporter permease n=1 Tax=Streptomonospora arabica TaxID=412417 RepID=A0ABV9STF8_9ACTN